MTKHTHTVIAEMVDSVTGERKFPNEGFTPHDEEQAARLIKAACLKEGAPAKSEAAAEERPKNDEKASSAKPAPTATKPAAAARTSRTARA